MHSTTAKLSCRTIGLLLRGQAEPIKAWTDTHGVVQSWRAVAFICVGAGLYGAAMGWWRAPVQGLFVAIKFPLIILLTALGNSLLNAMLAPLLGLKITLRQSFLAILLSFAIAAVILGAFSPLLAFLVWNVPPMTPDTVRGTTYSVIQLTHVTVISFAGAAANVRLFELLVSLGGNAAVARRVLFAWLAGNLFLGSQLAWILRPFIGSPALPVEFLRQTAFQGNFYETVFRAVLKTLEIN